MIYGYARECILSDYFSLDLQKERLLAEGVHISHLYIDNHIDKYLYFKHGKITPGLKACVKALRGGDLLIVFALNSLLLPRRNLLKVIRFLFDAGIDLKILTGPGKIIDTTVVDKNLVILAFELFYECQSALQSELTKEGLEAARSQGMVGGRRLALSERHIRIVLAELADRQRPVERVCKALGISRGTIGRYVGPSGELRPLGERVLAKSTGGARRKLSYRDLSDPSHAK